MNGSFGGCQGQAYYSPPLGMDRSDGYTYAAFAVQGVRTYDSTSQQWLTPDPYSGNVDSPMSQKPFVWNANNPLSYIDGSGLDPLFIDSETDATMPDTGWPTECGMDCTDPGTLTECTAGPSCVSSDPACRGCTPPSFPPVGSCSLDCQFARWNQFAASVLGVGTTVYRVFGGESELYGPYWSLRNPAITANYRGIAGLPASNTGEYTATGILSDPSQATTSTAKAIEEGQSGGMEEVQIQNATSSVQVNSVVSNGEVAPEIPMGELVLP